MPIDLFHTRNLRVSGAPCRATEAQAAKARQGCVVVISHKQFEDHHVEEQPLECELQGEDLNGEVYKLVRVANRTTSWARKNKLSKVVKAQSLQPAGADINYNKGELVIPQGSTIQVRFTI
jgi:hypothetical protein